MKNIFKKKIIINNLEETIELEALETWMVKWQTYKLPFMSSSFGELKDKAQAFTNKEDADLFAEALASAFKFIGADYKKITVKKEENGL